MLPLVVGFCIFVCVIYYYFIVVYVFFVVVYIDTHM